MSRFELAAAVLCVVPLWLAGCSGEPDSDRIPAGERTAAGGGTATVGLATGPSSPLPPFAATAADAEVSGLLYLALNVAEWKDGGLAYPEGHPLALATSWSVEGNRLTYRLDPARRWSDGRPVRAADVAFTYGLLLDSEGALPLSQAAARLDSVAAVDDSTVTFHFVRAYPGMLYDTGVGILPEHVFGAIAPDAMNEAALGAARGGTLVVSGPFAVAEWRPADRVVLVRSAAAEPSARLDRLVIRTLPDETARLAAFRVGQLDMAQVTSFHEAARLAAASGYRVERQPQRAYDYVAWNPAAHPAFADRSLRRALSLAIDRDAILAALEMERFAEKAYGPYGSLFAGLAPRPADGVWHDPDEARWLLDAAGWTDSDGDGIREKDGAELRFELSTTSGNERRETAAQAIQSQLAAVGVRADLRRQELASLFARAQNRDYEALLLGWQVGLDPDISFFWGDTASPVNVAAYDDATVRAHIDSALSAATALEAVPHWRLAAARIAADYPFAFLWFFDLTWAVGPRLEDVRVDVVGALRHAADWGIVAGG